MAYVETQNRDAPLCPQSFQPQHPMHRLHVETVDAFSGKIPTDADGETGNPDADAAYREAAYGNQTKMHLYEHTAFTAQRRTVRALWWHCSLCGCILPAYEVQP